MDPELQRVSAEVMYCETSSGILKQHTEIINRAFHKMHEAAKEGRAAITFDSRNFKCDFTQADILELCRTEHYFKRLGYNFKISFNSNNDQCVRICWDQALEN